LKEGTIIQKFRKVLEAQFTPRILGVHFNISAFAPFGIIAQFFYNFILFGVLWDEETGDMEYIPEDLHWHVSHNNDI
jgi:hypothetical protein